MAQGRTVYFDLQQNAPVRGALFERQKIWVAQRVPLRSTYRRHIEDNGGELVALEKDADILIADHVRSDAPPGSFSWTWIEACIKEGQLVDKEKHLAGAAHVTTRPVDGLQPTRSSRLPYTTEDDVALWNWVKDEERRGGRILGNEIYKQLEQKNNRHPWQSWRDRYIKRVRDNPPPGCGYRPISESMACPTPSEPVVNTAPTAPAPPSLQTEVALHHSQVKSTSKQHDPPEASPSLITPMSPQQIHTASTQFKPLGSKTTSASTRLPIAKPNVASTKVPQKPTSMSHQRIESNGSRPSAVGASPRSSASPLLHKASLLGASSRSATPAQGQRSRSSLARSECQPASDFKDFTNDDYDFFYKLAPSIQNTSVDKYTRLWLSVKSMRPTRRSADEWREYYERIIMPVWKEEDAHHFEGSPQSTSSVQASPQATQQFAPTLLTSGLTGAERGSARTPTSLDLRSPTPTRLTNPVVVIESPTKPSHLSSRTSQGSEPASKLPKSKTRGSPMSSQRVGQSDQTTSIDQVDRVPTSISSHPKRKASPVASASPSKRLRVEQNRVRLRKSPVPAKIIGKKVDFVNQLDLDKERDGTLLLQKQTTPFDIYESHGFPEGEKENFMLNGSGSPTLPARHVHVKSKEALEVFTDPPGEFLLQGLDEDDADAERDSWQDIDDLEAASQRMAHADAHDEALNATQQAAEEAEDEVIHSAAAQAATETNGDPEILDELRSEYETWHGLSGDEENPQRASADNQHTQALLNGATQMPDLDLPLPSDHRPAEDFDEVQYPILPNDKDAPEQDLQAEDDVRYPHLPRMSQESQDVEEAEKANEIDENESDYAEPDLDVPPPLEAGEMPPDGDDDDYDDDYDDDDDHDHDNEDEDIPVFESQIYSQPVKSVYSTSRLGAFPGRSSSMMTRHSVSSLPARSPTPPHLRTRGRGKPFKGTNHPTVSGITIKRELREAPHLAEGVSSPRSQYTHVSGSTAAWVASTLYTNSSPNQPSRVRDHLHTTSSRPSPVIAKQMVPQARSSTSTTARATQKTQHPSSSMLSESRGYQHRSSSPSTARLQPPAQHGSLPYQSPKNQPAPEAHTSKPTTAMHSLSQLQNSTAHSASDSAIHRVPTSTGAAPVLPPSMQPTSSSAPTSTAPTSFMNSNLAAGHPKQRIIESLQRASMNTTLARRVLTALNLGRGVPNDVRGIWTENDDEVMRGGAAGEMAALERFQGVEAYRKRREMLRLWGKI